MATAWALLAELEVGDALRAVIQRQDELPTRLCPSFIRLPRIAVLVLLGLIAQATRPRRICCRRTAHERLAAAIDLLRGGLVWREDIQSLIACQTKFE